MVRAVLGKWRLYFLKGPVPDWRADTGGNFCGYTAINSNKGNLAVGQKVLVTRSVVQSS